MRENNQKDCFCATIIVVDTCNYKKKKNFFGGKAFLYLAIFLFVIDFRYLKICYNVYSSNSS